MLLALLQLSAAFTPLPALTPSANAVRVEPVVCSAISSRRAALLAGGAAVASFLPSASQATQPTAVSGSLPTSASLALDLDDEEDRAVLQLAIIAAIILPSPFIGIQMVCAAFPQALAPLLVVCTSWRLLERCARTRPTHTPPPPCPLSGEKDHLGERR